MSSEKTAVHAPITQEIEERFKDLGVEDKSQETTEKKDDGAPAHMEDEKKESDLEDKAEIDRVEEKKDSDEEKVVKENEKEEEVAVSCVDHRTYAGDEGKTEDVPVTVVHEIHDRREAPSSDKKEAPSSGILYTVGTKVLTTATGVKDAIVGKCNGTK